ncbi:hypothetical protein BPOR_1842g00010 [Botrytis porri]|uniref:Uncharacterized protein n=1 Tax=Botrytis porri TaxID=87229 RepID=A0A4Z1K343_9HELO|nr:hypothetical protein BPOR_1842g00010 [Botrytis porri]
MDPNCCIVTETLSTICGHVTTVIEHHRSCELIQFDPYRAAGYDLKFLLEYHPWTKTRMASAPVAECKCISCDAIEKGASSQPFRPPPNTWISDVFYREISFALSLNMIADRRKSWESYISDQTILFQRQKRFDDVLETAQQDLIAYNASSGDAGDEQALYHLNSNVEKAEIIRSFYDHHQNEYLLQFRGLKNMSMRFLFDPAHPTHLTFGLLRLVKPKDIPAREVCGICREIMYSENRNNNTVTCPMCRTTLEMYKPPNVLDHE